MRNVQIINANGKLIHNSSLIHKYIKIKIDIAKSYEDSLDLPFIRNYIRTRFVFAGRGIRGCVYRISRIGDSSFLR